MSADEIKGKPVARRRKNKPGKARDRKVTVGKRYDVRGDAPPRARAHGSGAPGGPRRNARRPRSLFRKIFGKLFYWSLIASFWGVFIGGIVLAIYASDLPDTNKIWEVERQPSITFVDSNGQTIAVQGAAYAPPVVLENMPPDLIHAVLSVEDRRFYSHFGVDILGLLRATWVNLRAGRIVQGGSTLTQQLAKNLFLSSERTYKRKIQEVMLALWLEHKFTKDEILSLYLNRVYFGRGAWGVEAASSSYFGKPASQLNLGEAAMIAGLLKAPNRYSPTSDLARAERRATIVLDTMVRNKKISEVDRELAFATPILVKPSKATPSASYFVDWLAPQVRRQVGEVKTDLLVVTTLNLNAQRAAERALRNHLTKEQAKKRAGQGALVAVGPSGAIRAMSGGRAYAASQFNRATQARRQPGSAFKPFVYLAAIESGLSPWSIREDKPIQIGDWSPQNYKKEYKGEMSLTDALAKSVNTIAVQLSEEIGRARVAAVARRLGMDSPIATTRSMPLGSNETSLIELTSSYAPFANGGYRAKPYGMVKIKVQDGPVLWQRKQIPAAQVIAPHDLGRIKYMLEAVVAKGTGRKARIPDIKIGGKTGTTNDFRDAWFVGYGNGQTAGVWIGDDKNRAMDHVTGGTLPTQIWHDFMQEYLPSVPKTDPEPAAIVPPIPPKEPVPLANEPAEEDPLGNLLSSLSEKLE